MKLETERFGLTFIGSAKVSHSVKKTYKGIKLSRIQNKVDNLQAGSLDNKIKWAKHKEQRKLERKQRQESI